MNALKQLSAKILFLGLSIFNISNAFAGTPREKKDSSSELEIQGKIILKNTDLKEHYTLEVIHFNTVTSSITVRNSETFKVRLKKNVPCVIRITKKGFMPRTICINTNTAYKESAPYSFALETQMIDAREAMQLDDEALKLPVAIISYNSEKGNFDADKDYTTFVHQKIYSEKYQSAN